MPRQPHKITQRAKRRHDYDKYRPSAAKRGYDDSWRRLRLSKLRQNPICEMCRTAAATEVDHIIPIRRGGARLEWANLRSCCRPCHGRKTVEQDGAFGRPTNGSR